MSSDVQPGWYQNPDGSNSKRYWDGNQWTNAVADNDIKKPLEDSDNTLRVKSNFEENIKVKENNDFFLIPLHASSKLKIELEKLHPNFKKNFDIKFEKDSELIESYFDYSYQKFRQFRLYYFDKNTVIAELLAQGRGNNVQREDLVKLYKLLTENKNVTSTHSASQGKIGTGNWFQNPLYKDWILITWVALTVLAWLPAAYRVVVSGGPFFTAGSILSGTIDALVYPVTLMIIFLIPILVIRKFYWHYKNINPLTTIDKKIISFLLVGVAAVVGILFYQDRQIQVAAAKSQLTKVCAYSKTEQQISCVTYPDIFIPLCLKYENTSASIYLNPKRLKNYVSLNVEASNKRECSGGLNYFEIQGNKVMDVMGGEYEVWISNWEGAERSYEAPDETSDFLTIDILVE